MGLFSHLFSPKKAEPEKPSQAKAAKTPQKAPSTKVVTHKVAGTSYRQKEIRTLGKKNPDFRLSDRQLYKRDPDGGTVYEYAFSPKKVELVPEPENPHDPKAIKVLVDGVHVGYIKAGSCAHIHRLLQENRIQSIEARIIGGRYKSWYTQEDHARSVDDYEFYTDEDTIGVRLEITEILPPMK